MSRRHRIWRAGGLQRRACSERNRGRSYWTWSRFVTTLHEIGQSPPPPHQSKIITSYEFILRIGTSIPLALLNIYMMIKVHHAINRQGRISHTFWDSMFCSLRKYNVARNYKIKSYEMCNAGWNYNAYIEKTWF